jgi:hypothetical protein
MRAVRVTVAVLVSAVLGPIGLWAAAVAAVTLVEQVLAGFGVIADAQWSQALNPAVWIGIDNLAGNGSVLDSLVGGPGAPGGTAGRWLALLVTGAVAAVCWTVLRLAWAWAARRDG